MHNQSMHQQLRPGRGCRNRSERSAFTLVELLIVMTIIVILLAMTVTAVNFNRDADRARGAAAQVQSFLAGARDRAIYAKEARGVRFFLDPDNNRAVTTMVYIDPAEYWSDGTIQLQRWDADENGETDTSATVDINGDGVNDDPTSVWVVAGQGTAWWELKRRGMLFDGMRIRIPKGPTGDWYPIRTGLIDITAAPLAVQKLVLTIPYRDPADTPTRVAKAFESGGPVDYELELPPRILPMDPVLLPEGTVVDLDGSQLPPAWRPSIPAGGQGSGNLQYSQFMDIVFSPRGNVVGSAAAAGLIHLYVCDNADSITLKEEFTKALAPHPSAPANPATLRYAANGQDLPIAQVYSFNAGQGAYPGIRSFPFVPADEINTATAAWLPGYDTEAYLVKDRRIVSVFTQTGAVSIHPVDPSDSTGDGLADDPFFFAETGETAN